MDKILSDVADFHVACDIPFGKEPEIPPGDRRNLRISLIREESGELLQAMHMDDIVEIADGMADLIYVIAGAALEYGIPLAEVWDEVQRTNMAKVDPRTDKVRRRADGKILKPEGWQPPAIGKILRETKLTIRK